MRRAYRGKILTPHIGSTTLEYIADGMLVVDGEKIHSVGPFSRNAFHGPVLDMHPAVLVPGFVDAHVHFPQTRVVGSASGPLLEWLTTTVFPEEARFAEEGYARTVAREFITRTVAVGTTTSAVFSSSSPLATRVLFQEMERAGVRAFVGLTLMDQNCPEALGLPREEAIRACRELIADWHGRDRGRLCFAITPRFALSCSRGLMEDAARLAHEHDLFIQTHIAEHPAEGASTLAAHPHARDYLDVYAQAGLLGERTLLAHAIHLSPSEWDRVAALGAKIVHCPDSNFFLGSGRMNIGEAHRRGVTVSLGSDVAAGRSFDMRRAMASAYDTALCCGVRLEPADVFRLSTVGGAEVLGLGAVTGSLESGKDADFAVFDLPGYVEGCSAVLSHLVFASEEAKVRRVFVRGLMIGPAS